MSTPAKNLTTENYNRRVRRLYRALNEAHYGSDRRRAVKSALFRLVYSAVR